ncbi:MAG: ferrous iron transport protein B [Caldilineaceae bacterium]|nr:ferrous iron transport protein B [Caldilineaceae bacterium]
MTIHIALAGNPNVGKSTIFNALTGSRQHVGNWPGKTVEKKEGRFRIDDEEILLVDLPGTYSLAAYSVEEIIARDFIIHERPNAVIAVVDSANLERNLYLVAQILELDVPVILALNMQDIAQSRGLKIDKAALAQKLGGAPVVETVGNRNRGLDDLKQVIHEVTTQPPQSLPQPVYPKALEQAITDLESKIQTVPNLTEAYRARWLAVKMLENDPAILEYLEEMGAADLLAAGEAAQAQVEEKTGEDTETLIVDRRYEFIGDIVGHALERPSDSTLTLSDRADEIITHRIWGLPIFLLIMWLVFQFTANVSAPFLDWVDVFINERVARWAGALFGAVGLGDTWLSSVIIDGVIAGVGGVLVFVPVLLFLYMALALLEDSGYMARAAFVMDRVMRTMGLHGKSFLPMIVGFGCTVPAVYATRTLENEKDRKLTGFLATFMSCGARLPVYVVFGTAFFGAAAGNLIFAMYMLGIGVALATGFAMKHTIYKGQPPAPFVMELPPYRMPRPIDVWRQMWERTRGFLVKAGTVIMSVSIVIWLLMAIPVRGDGAFNDVAPAESLYGAASGLIAPVFAPAGFGSWQASGSLITGFLAKEVVVSTMSQVYGVTEADGTEEPVHFGAELGESVVDAGKAVALTVQEIANILPRTINLIPGINLSEFDFLRNAGGEEENSRLETALVASFNESAGSPAWGAIAAVAFNVFVLLYVPCMAAVAAMRHEFGARWMWLQIGYTLGLAWLAAVLVFQIGKVVI